MAARITVWSGVSSFGLVVLATGLLYQGLSAGLAHEDDVLLSQNINALSRQLEGQGPELEDLRKQLDVKTAPGHSPWLWVRVQDGAGRRVAETAGMDEVLPPGVFPGLGPGLPDDRSPMQTLSRGGRTFRLMAARVPWPRHRPGQADLQVAVDMSSDVGILGKFKERLWAILAVSLLACLAGGYWIARYGIRPVHDIVEAASRIKSTTLHERLGTDELPSELSDLASTFNEMLDRLEASFNRLSRFSSDIAHELRTPIQNLRSEAEVTLGKPRSAEEYRELLGSCLEEYRRLSNLIDRLLFLARAENPQTQIQREKLLLAREFSVLGDFYGSSIGEMGLRFRVEAPPDLELDADRALFQRAVGNLVENAMKYTPAGGAILLKAFGSGNSIRVEVSDTGTGIPSDQLSRVFDRFYRVDSSRSLASGGSGLGLSIVQSIMNLHGGVVEIQSTPSQGTTVSLFFPAA